MGVNEWTVIVAALVVLVGSVWNLIATSKQTKDLDSNSNERHKSRKTEHDSLSKEHTGLSKEIAGVQNDVARVGAVANHLRDEAIKAEALKQALPKQELNLTAMLNHMTAIIEDNAKLREDIVKLRVENMQAHTENRQLNLELERTKEHIHARTTRNNKPSHDLEHDDELEL